MKCRRCNGTGKVHYRYGVPGQDMHKPYRDIVWQDEGRWRDCPVCLGLGVANPPRAPREPEGSIAIHCDDYTTRAIIESLGEENHAQAPDIR